MGGTKMTISIDLKMNGLVNSKLLSANGKLMIESDGNFHGNLIFEEIPASFHPKVLGSSGFSINCGSNADAVSRTRNLSTISNGNYQATRSYVIEDSNKKVVGSLVSSVQMRKQSENVSESIVTIYGHYSGPVNILSCSNYDIKMIQKSPGRIGGEYQQTFVAEDQKTYIIYGSTEYVYSTQESITSPVIWKHEYKQMDFEKSNDNRSLLKGSIDGKATVVPIPESKITV